MSLRKTHCACISLRRANRAVCRLYDLVLTPAGLKSSQFMILQVIEESGEIAQCDLAEEFLASVETLSRRLSSARSAGWVEMRAGERQRRLYRLTPLGRRKLAEAMPYWEMAQIQLRAAMEDKDWDLLPDFLSRVAAAALQAETMPVRRRAADQPSRKTAPATPLL